MARCLLATHPDRPGADDNVRRFVRFGVSPRVGQSLLLAAKANALLEGRFNVSMDDLRSALRPTLRHRFQLNYEGEANPNINAEALLTSLFDRCAVAD